VIPRPISSQFSAICLKIRADTAEYFYLFLQGSDVLEIDEDAEIALLETEWWAGFF